MPRLEKVALNSPVVHWAEFAILRTYRQVYRLTPKPKGWRRLLRWTRGIRRKYGE
jgi:hypothetical protein